MNPTPSEPDQAPSAASLALERLMGQMPPNLARSFTDSQREALQSALANTIWQKHAVDIRLSIPLLIQRYYVVFVAGPEKRSEERRQQERGQRSVSIPRQMAMAAVVTTLGIGALAMLMYLTQSQSDVVDQRSVSPAAIPFLGDRTTCEHSGRTWDNGECLDFDHDPTF